MTLAAALALAGGAVGCGGDNDDGGGPRLAWAAAPTVFAPQDLPGDRILSGRVRNTGSEAVELKVTELQVELRRGGVQAANGRFAEAFGHGLYGPGGPPAPLQASRYDQRRLGEIATIAPGQTKPLTVAWRGDAKVLKVGRWRLAVPRVRAAGPAGGR